MSRTTINVCIFSPYIEKKLSSKQTLLVLGGKAGGPTDNFPVKRLKYRKAFADRMHLLREKSYLNAESLDGKLAPMDICSETMDLRIGKAIFDKNGRTV